MPTAKRTIVEIVGLGYKEVSLEFRIQRAKVVQENASHTDNRLRCPVLDASLRSDIYGLKALPSTDRKGLEQWCKGLGAEDQVDLFAKIAYLSGPFLHFFRNKRNQSFDEGEINTGFIVKSKNNVNTAILRNEKYDQDKLNELVWAIFPELKEKKQVVDESFLYADNKEANLLIREDKIGTIVEHNRTNSDSCSKWLGSKLSESGEFGPLLKLLGQPITAETKDEKDKKGGKDDAKGKTVQALSLRDLHDLYKYGLFPAPLEERFLSSGLIQESSIALTGKSA
eukprot:scaffold1501_cov130-Cylindrotheca_fusiformis.AAC.14